MSRQISPAATLRSRSAASRRSSVKSPAAGSGRGNMRSSNSAPSLKGQTNPLGTSGSMKSMVLGTMAQTMGARVASTLHHRGEHECGAITDPNDEHVYVPRAQWTQSADHPLKANNAQWNQQHFMASELKRLHGEEKYKEYLRREVDRQLAERTDMRSQMQQDKRDFAELVKADVIRHNQDQKRKQGAYQEGINQMKQGITDQRNHMGKRAHEALVREAQEQAEMKMRTVQQMCEEMAEEGRRRKQRNQDMRIGMQDNENRRIQKRLEKDQVASKERQEIRESLMQDEYKAQASMQRVKDAQDVQDARVRLYEATAGKALRMKNEAEENRIDNDEKKHLLRTDTFFSQRERAREKQRQNMVNELDRQSAACEQKRACYKLAKEAERQAVQAASKRSLDAELAKASQKRAEEQQLQQELRVMMMEKEERESKMEGYSKPTAMSTMNLVMRKNGNVCHKVSDMQNSMEAARYTHKPLGREQPGMQAVPLDASIGTLRKITREKSFKAEIPVSSVLGGVVGTLGGGGGQVMTALMATGGPYLPKACGIAVQDRKLDSHWHEGLRPEHLKAGRDEARRREAAKQESNRDW